MTTGISLVRENAEAMQPPRSLWVSFPLGRPLGRAGDAAFQQRVIAHALALLTRPQGPVLEDFPEDLTPDANETEAEAPPACPISFSAKRGDSDSWKDRLLRELDSLNPWYKLSLRRRERTTVGISKDNMETILETLADWLDDRTKALPEFVWLKHATEDAKAWYGEALTAQPGDYPPGYAEQLLWQQTVLGECLKEYYTYFESVPEKALFARLVASREAVEGSTGGAEALHKALSEGRADDKH